MLAAQAAHQAGPVFENEDEIVNNDALSDADKKEKLQKAINMAASNGDVERTRKLLDGKARQYIDVNAVDDDGTPPLIYASCFVSPTIISIRKKEIVLTCLIGPRTCSTGIDRSRRRCQQAGSKSVERSHVGYDEPT